MVVIGIGFDVATVTVKITQGRQAYSVVGGRMQHFCHRAQFLDLHGCTAKAYAQDWVYAVGNMMIPVVALLAVGLALPFFRRMDATSAYEYLNPLPSRPRLLAVPTRLFHLSAWPL